MVAGHFAVALASAGRVRALPMGILIMAAYSGDLVEGIVAAVNVPDPTRVWSHSFPATAAAGAVLAAGWLISGGRWREALALVVVSMSHSALDFVTGYKTMWPGHPPVGLRLYGYPAVEGLFEIAFIAGGWAVWRFAVPPERRKDALVWSMLGLLILAQTTVVAGVLLFGAQTDPTAMSKFVR